MKMKSSMSLIALSLAVFAPLVGATEYPLQFTPNPGYRGLVVAGYTFSPDGQQVIGNCSYYTVSSGGSGKGGGSRATKTYAQTCTWDLNGNLISMVKGALPIPVPLYVNGSQIIYAVNAAGDSTGADSVLPGKGFVSTPGAHYTWLTPQNHGVLQQMVYTLTATLTSDGDVPLDVTEVTPSALQGAVKLVQPADPNSTNCIGETKPGATCTITVQYDPTKLTSPIGLVLDTLRIDLTSNAGAGHDFMQVFTIVVPGKL